MDQEIERNEIEVFVRPTPTCELANYAMRLIFPIAILLSIMTLPSAAQELLPHTGGDGCPGSGCPSDGFKSLSPLAPIPNPGPPANICVASEGYCILLAPEPPGAACSCLNSRSGFPVEGRAFFSEHLLQ